MDSTETLVPKGGKNRQTVIFRLADESFGIDIFRVVEIIRLREITPIPHTEAHIRGLVNLRGKTIPVVDLRSRLKLDAAVDLETSRIIVVDSDHGNIGVMVDAVTEVMTLMSEDIETAPSLVSDPESDFVEAVARRQNDLVTLLNLDRALAA